MQALLSFLYITLTLTSNDNIMRRTKHTHQGSSLFMNKKVLIQLTEKFKYIASLHTTE